MAENLKHLFSRGLNKQNSNQPFPEQEVAAVDYAPFECTIAAASAKFNNSEREAVANFGKAPLSRMTTGVLAKNDKFRKLYSKPPALQAVLAQNYDANGVAFEASYRFPGKAVRVVLTAIALIGLIVYLVANS